MTDRVSRPADAGGLRIGDAERTAAADDLGEHYAQGRLSTEEHHERLDRIWAARTRSELTPIFSDLPGSAYQARASYASADRVGVGSERTRQAPFSRPPFSRPAFGRPPFSRPAFSRPAFGRPAYGRPAFGRPAYVGPRRGLEAVRASRGPTVLLRLVMAAVLVIALVALVVAHLPLILLGVLVWVFLVHKRRPWHAYQSRD
jgi:Domain of unknown function (DUF1707)